MRSWGKKSEIRIKSKLRLVMFLFVLALSMLLLVLSPLFNKGQAMAPTYFKTYIVAQGDTLWGIAKQTLPYKTDIRDYVSEIREANELDNANIKIGQKLKIPIR